ncbi:MAG: hypothetical protein NW220_17315 [Leptolyngbyaceae cyanobacterium bins.349]|nr:hypothetical protein [Leptolyngbyaceae cyanobacterium bins.349]
MTRRFVKPLKGIRRSRLPVIGAIALIGISTSVLSASLQARPLLVKNSVAPEWVSSNPAIAALAAHLKKVGAKMYGAYWCPHCTRQKEMFGAALRDINYVECDPRGENAKPKLCSDAGVKGYPTWDINGKSYVGVQSLEELANASNYKGPRNF